MMIFILTSPARESAGAVSLYCNCCISTLYLVDPPGQNKTYFAPTSANRSAAGTKPGRYRRTGLCPTRASGYISSIVAKIPSSIAVFHMSLADPSLSLLHPPNVRNTSMMSSLTPSGRFIRSGVSVLIAIQALEPQDSRHSSTYPG